MTPRSHAFTVLALAVAAAGCVRPAEPVEASDDVPASVPFVPPVPDFDFSTIVNPDQVLTPAQVPV